MPKFRPLLYLLASGLLLSLSCRESPPENTRPNIVFIFADDQSFNTLHALGGHEVITPHLDRLVRSGVTFTHSFNMGGWNGAVCLASRAMLLTGRSIWNARRADSLMRNSAYPNPLWGELIQQAGYDTYLTGKWHVTKPAEAVFQHVTHVRPGMPAQTPEGYNRPTSPTDTTWQPWDTTRNGFWAGGKHWSEVLADDAVSFIDQATERGKPYFMYLAFNAPHDPRQSPESFIRQYPLSGIATPANFLPEYPYNEAMGSGRTLRDERLAPFPRTEYAVKVNRREYYALITHMDAQIGRILAALEASGTLDNTYLIFTADHGLSVGQHGLLGKQNMYDHSIRVPLVIVGPDVPEEQRIDAPVYLQDIMPTVLELTGADRPDFVEFKSLLPLLRGARSRNYASIYGCYTDKQRMIRTDRHKLIAYPEAGKLRLFDLSADPLEMTDLADDPRHQTLKSELWEELLALQQSLNDSLDLTQYAFDFQE